MNEQTTRGKKGKANSSKSLTVNLLGAAVELTASAGFLASTVLTQHCQDWSPAET